MLIKRGYFGPYVLGLLHRVKVVVMSSRVNLSLLVDHINSLPRNANDVDAFDLDPNLKFKILSAPSSSSTALPPIKQHFPESFFSFDVSTEELKQIGSQQSLHDKVQSAFTNKLAAYATLLQRRTFDIPEDVLCVLLPFLYGKELTTLMLNDIIVEVGKLMGTTTTTTTITTPSSETMKKSRKRAKRG